MSLALINQTIKLFEYQTKKMNKNEIFLVKSRKESSIYIILKGPCLFTLKGYPSIHLSIVSIYNTKRGRRKTKLTDNGNTLTLKPNLVFSKSQTHFLSVEGF